MRRVHVVGPVLSPWTLAWVSSVVIGMNVGLPVLKIDLMMVVNFACAVLVSSMSFTCAIMAKNVLIDTASGRIVAASVMCIDGFLMVRMKWYIRSIVLPLPGVVKL